LAVRRDFERRQNAVNIRDDRRIAKLSVHPARTAHCGRSAADELFAEFRNPHTSEAIFWKPADASVSKFAPYQPLHPVRL
jgi:hypothetical protein